MNRPFRSEEAQDESVSVLRGALPVERGTTVKNMAKTGARRGELPQRGTGRLPPLAFAMLLVLSGCASARLEPRIAGSPGGCAATARSLASSPGQSWWREQAWRFATPEQAAAEYAKLVDAASPWPDWIKPAPATLPPGTRLQMAIGGSQTVDQPGGFATFDNIDEVADVRDGLAVRAEWKPQVDRAVTYEITRPLPVLVGPVGPQVDSTSCRLLPGRWSQVQLLVPPSERGLYLKVVEVRPIR